MSKSYLLIGVALFVLVGVGIFFVTKQTSQSLPFDTQARGAHTQKLRVATTIYPLYDLVRQVAGSRADVTLIIPPGASEHHFEVTPRLIAELQGTQIIFAIGHGLDAWALQVASAIPNSIIDVVDRGIAIRESTEKDEGPTDPHYWLAIGNARTITNTIAENLSARDPGNAEFYRSNAETVKKNLTEEEKNLRVHLEPYRGSAILVFHDAWFYFAEDFGLEIAGAFEPFVAEEPTPRHLAELATMIREKKITTLFIEPQLSSTAIESFAEDNGLGIATLDPLGGVPGRLTYAELMRYNAEQVLSALRTHDGQ